MKTPRLESCLTRYALDSRNSINNIQLAFEYEKLGHYAAAVSYYLRAAELSTDQALVYESLLKSWACIQKVGNRVTFEKGQLLDAIAHSPTRPEAYFFICSWLELHAGKHEKTTEEKFRLIYSYACIGISMQANHQLFQTDTTYPGSYGLIFYRAYSAWHVGKIEESKSLMLELWNEHALNDDYKKHVWDNIVNLGLDSDINVTSNQF